MANEKRIAAALMGVLVAGAWPARSIVVRHDRDDARYRRLAEGHGQTVRVGRAHGTLIDERWVLTAAHVAMGVSPVSGSVTVGGREIPVDRVVLHPSWRGDLGPGRAEPDWLDLALLRLVRPVTDVAPAHLYTRRDEPGKTIVFPGRGLTGDGQTGATTEDGRMRAATNVVSDADDDWLYFDFDAPPDGTDLEGIAGPGDSGNGALLDVAGRRYVLGVGSRNIHLERGLKECTYGTTEVYARVSSHVDWIRRSMRRGDRAGSLVPIEADWPDTAAGSFAKAFFARYGAADKTALRHLAESRFSGRLAQVSPAADWAAYWSGHRLRSGAPRPVAIAHLQPHIAEVLVAYPDRWRTFRFVLEGTAPHRVLQLDAARTPSRHGEPLGPPPATPKPEGESP